MITQSPKRLIINADDFGADEPTSRAIASAAQNGLVTAATALVNLSGFAASIPIFAAIQERLDLGLHANLSWGPTLTGRIQGLAPRGHFPGKLRALCALELGLVPEAALRRELKAQVETFVKSYGLTPTHIDVHQHLHFANRALAAVQSVAEEAQIPFVRWPSEKGLRRLAPKLIAARFAGRQRPAPPLRTTDAFFGLEATGHLDLERFRALLATVPEGLSELMVHPGLQGIAGQKDRLAKTRVQELALLTSNEARAAVEEFGIALSDFRSALETPDILAEGGQPVPPREPLP